MLTVLLVDDDAEFTEVACTIIEFLGHEVLTAATLKEARDWLEKETFDHVLLDFMLPDGSGAHLFNELDALPKRPRVTLITGHPSVKSVIKGLCGPTVDYLVKPIQREEIEAVLSQKPKEKAPAQEKIEKHFDLLIGESPIMKELYKLISRVSKTSANVMLLGESGVGKEVVAAAIHRASESEGPYIATNCGAFSKELIGSELFGHEKGAFTGAVGRKEGVFEQAEGGTLFLDEITEMPIDMQPNLLRVLENKVVIRVGGTKTIPVSCRVVSATNRTMEEIAQSKVLREDIYFRLAVFPITIPPLRERKEDIPLLAKTFIAEFNKDNGSQFKWEDSQLDTLQAYDWPGNVRELANLVERLSIMHPYGVIGVQELPKKFRYVDDYDENRPVEDTGMPSGIPGLVGLDAPALLPVNGIDLKDYLSNLEKQLIQQALDEAGGVVARAAEKLRIRRTTLVEKVRKYGLREEESEES